MNENEKLPEWIDRYNRNELHGKELEDFLVLLEQDPELKKEVLLDRDLNRILSEKEIIELRKKIIKVKPRINGNNSAVLLWMLAASVVILIGLAYYSIFQWNKTKTKLDISTYEFGLNDSSFNIYKEQINPNQIEIDRRTIDSAISRESRGDSSIRLRVRAEMADNFDPYLPFEGLVGEINRSSYFRLIQPLSDESFVQGSKITFTWETDSFFPLKLEVTNNNGLTVYKSENLKAKTITIYSRQFTPGLYYFKFFQNEEMVYFEKFTIK